MGLVILIVTAITTPIIIAFFSKIPATAGKPGWLSVFLVIVSFLCALFFTYAAYLQEEIDFIWCIVSSFCILFWLYTLIYHFFVKMELKNNTFYFVDIFFRKHSFPITSDTFSCKESANNMFDDIIIIYYEGKKYYIVNNIYGAHEILENLPKRNLKT